MEYAYQSRINEGQTNFPGPEFLEKSIFSAFFFIYDYSIDVKRQMVNFKSIIVYGRSKIEA